MINVKRRDFLKTAAAATAAGSLASTEVFAEDAPAIVVVEGKNIAKMMAAGMKEIGGWGAIVKKGGKVTVKPNAAWASKPEHGGNTHPEIIAACVSACKAAGASEVIVPEKTCSKAKDAFKMSGIESAVKKAGGKIYSAEKDEHFQSTAIPGATKLKKVDLNKDVANTDCLINIPVAKHHRTAKLTLSMKNWMGAIKDRRYLHKNDLNTCIAELSTLIKPKLIIIDATRIMLDKGPRGPGPLAHPNKIIFGTDPVACDAYAATLFKKKPFDIPHIKVAHEMKIGCGDLSKVNVKEIKV